MPKRGSIYIARTIYLVESSFLANETDWSEVGGQLFQSKQYNMYMDVNNIIQLAWDNKWIIPGAEANVMDILRVKMFAEY